MAMAMTCQSTAKANLTESSVAEPINIKQGHENKLAKNFMKSYHERGNKTRGISQEDANKFGMSIETKPGAVMGSLSFKSPEHRKAFDDHMRSVYAAERASEDEAERSAQASQRRQSFKVYGSGHNMVHHGEGKPHGHD